MNILTESTTYDIYVVRREKMGTKDTNRILADPLGVISNLVAMTSRVSNAKFVNWRRLMV